MTTGGSTSGRCSTALSASLPQKRQRASANAARTAGGRPRSVLQAATRTLRPRASDSAGVRGHMAVYGSRATKPRASKTARAAGVHRNSRNAPAWGWALAAGTATV